MAFSVDKATRIMVDKFNAERVGEQELEGGWWDSKHRLEFILSKQKWSNGQRQKKFGAAGRLAGEPGTFVDVQSLWELLDKALH